MSIANTFKHTSIGLIPNDWEVKKLGKITKTTAGGTPSTQKTEYWGGNIKWMSSGDLNLKKIFDVEGRISEIGLKNSSTKIIPPKCILIGLAGQGKTRGTVAINLIELCTNQSVAAIFPSKEFHEEYLYYNLDFRYNELRQLSTGDGGRGGLNLNIINSISVPLPSLPEQQKIAEILSTFDEAINTTRQIIKELKVRNKGLANQLLTGRTRVKGFEKSKWNEVKANKIFKSHTDKTHNGKLEILSATQERGVIPRSMNNIDIKYDASSLGTYKKVEIGDYVISLRSFQGGIEYSEYEGIVSPAYTILKEIVPISKLFYKVYFKTETFINRLNTIIYGIRDGKQIGFGDFSTLNLPYPSIEEQKAIANILNAAKRELMQYEEKLNHLQLQKKGLMQQLLTGKTRTV